MRTSLRHAIVPGYLLLCLLLGGASAAGYWANLALQLLALPIIFAAMTARGRPATPAGVRQGDILLLLVLLLIALQLVPLPPFLWTHLPGRGAVAAGYALIGRPLPWLPLSLEPYATVSSALWLLPAVAVYLAATRLGGFRSGWTAWAIVGVTVAGVTLGALQVGGSNGFYFYRITNFGKAVGFFANSNHMGMLMVTAVPFLAALFFDARRKGRSLRRTSAFAMMLAGALGIILVGLAINRSRAGIGLAVPVAAITLLALGSSSRRRNALVGLGSAALMVAALGAIFLAPVNGDVAAATHATAGSRAFFLQTTMRAVHDVFPAGSGIGTFQPLYRTYEDPALTDRLYTNHAHDDYLELLLETGIPGMLLVLLFLGWFVARTMAVWRSDENDYFARAASVAAAAMLAHSLVDYPLRTAAMSAFFAFCIAVLAGARPYARPSRKREDGGLRHVEA